jgi:succinyl-CoA synthetase beta subunit
MKLHEYQAKALLRKKGLPVPRGEVVFNKGEVAQALKGLGMTRGVAKAQAFTGGRGKAGGIKMFADGAEAEKVSEALIGMTLVTHQTGPEGVKIEAVLLEEASQISRELYCAWTLDRAKSSPVLILSPAGGMDIEEIAEHSPEKILKLHPDFEKGLKEAFLKQSADFLGLAGKQYDQWKLIVQGLYEAYLESDADILEINPLAVNGDGDLAVLDCKVVIDENALFRQQNLGGDPNGDKDPAEIEAGKYGLSYIKLDGNIGCLVNGAGLAMATMDIIAHYGAQPANFLDVGGSATEEAVTKAFEIICADANVKAILVNIFGGIMPCDRIARGIIGAVNNTGLKLPLVVRLEGTNVQEGKKLIVESGLSIISAEDLEDGAKKAASLVGAGRA